MKIIWLVGKIIVLLAAAFALVALGLLLHALQIDLSPLAGKLGTLIGNAAEEMEAAKQTTQDVDSGVSYEVNELKKPTPKALAIVKGIASVLGNFVSISKI
jgi:hypothetical protein